MVFKVAIYAFGKKTRSWRTQKKQITGEENRRTEEKSDFVLCIEKENIENFFFFQPCIGCLMSKTASFAIGKVSSRDSDSFFSNLLLEFFC